MKKFVVFALAICLLLGCYGCFRVEYQLPQNTMAPPDMDPIRITENDEQSQETVTLTPEGGQSGQLVPGFAEFAEKKDGKSVRISMDEMLAYESAYADCNGTYFRDLLSGEDLCIYNCYLYALENCYTWFKMDVQDSTRDVFAIREALCLDTPFIEQSITATGEKVIQWTGGPEGDQIEVEIKQFAKERWDLKMEALDRCRQIVSTIPATCTTQLEKMEYLHRYVCDNMEYVLYQNNVDIDYLYDAVIRGKSVCDGYSNMLSLLFNLIGVECCETSGYDTPAMDTVGHTWVTANVDGVYYNFDATFEDTKGDNWGGRLIFFGVSDAIVNKPYCQWEQERPKCTDTSRDLSQAEVIITDLKDELQIKNLVQLAEDRATDGETMTLIYIHETLDEKKCNDFLDDYIAQATKAQSIASVYVPYGTGTMLLLTVTLT